MSTPSPTEECPFGTCLSLGHLIDFWERQDGDPSSLHAPMARVIVEKLEEAPELRERSLKTARCWSRTGSSSTS